VGSGPEHQWFLAAGHGHMLASNADREQVADVLKAAFVQGQLSRDELEVRIAQTFTSRTYADLAVVMAGIPAAPVLPVAVPRGRRPVGSAARWCASGLVTPAVLAVAFWLEALAGHGGSGALAFVVALVYFVVWLSVGADMLWEWYSLSLPTARPCVRCAHTAASHRAPASCTARLGSLSVLRRCTCQGYVPPGRSPRAADRRVAAARPS
jgi:hypothetical protein